MNAIDGSSARRVTATRRLRSRSLVIIFALATFLAAGAVAVMAQQEDGVAGLSRDEALRLGERMYRQGILPSGEPMRAFVQQDIEVDGTMFSCQSCHVRSGMGAREGTVVTNPTCGSWLYKPLQGAEMKPESQARVPSRLDPPPFRPAYTDKTLARAIRLGKDPNDRVLNYVMPRYQLNGTDMDILVYYLKNLSATWSPGVDDTTIRFATVVGPDVPEVDRKAMLDALDVQVRVHNSQMRHDERRATSGPFFKEEKYAPYRRFALAVWQLEGPPESWFAQLDAYYEKEPVFAMLAGITTGEWAPIHEFAERRQIPCLFPITDYPVISDSDWYTVYYSKGYFQEGDAAAHFLRRADNVPGDAQVLQIFRGDRTGRDLAAGFRDGRRSMRLPPPVDIELAVDAPVNGAFWQKLASANPGAVLAVWLDAGDLQSLEALAAAELRPPMVFVSSTMMGDAVTSLPEAVRGFTYLTCPHSFPDDNDRARLVTTSWIKARGLQVTNFDIQAKMYFLEWTLAPMIMMMRDDFYRDYFLDILDMMRDQYYSIAVYPRLSFGPGQRYASKGCYIAQLTAGPEPTLEKRSTWVIH
jgi:hypothetical protein